ncbi:Gfo/Idh/MocA family oxidoreductase [Photorhabdus sp. RM96S]|uniref:Gfo/Idh/MocA family protein n=1 Tax=Photorhabdus sp. RM96S TaxID=3342822 RepID=UPI0036DCD0DB
MFNQGLVRIHGRVLKRKIRRIRSYNYGSFKGGVKKYARALNAGGGVWLDMGYHIVDLLCYLFDCHEINVNYSKLINTSNGKYNVDDTAFVEFQYGNVIIFVYISCVAYEKYEDITLIGDDFIVYANRNQLKIKNKKQEVISEKYFHPDDESPFVDMYQDFLFSKEKDSFSNNLKNSIVITNLLENAFIESGYKII